MNNLIDILCGDKHFDSMIARFVVFMNSATSTPKLTRLGLAILHTLSRDPRTIAALRGNTSSVKNLQKLIPSIADPQKTQAQEILAKVEEGIYIDRGKRRKKRREKKEEKTVEKQEEEEGGRKKKK